MIREPENIENRVRNTLGPIQTLHDIAQEIVGLDADTIESVRAYEFLVHSDLIKNAQKSIDRLILLAKAADMKINDKTFCVEDYIVENNICLEK